MELRARRVTEEAVQQVEAKPLAVGAIAALRRSMRALGLGGSLTAWELPPAPDLPPGVWRPGLEPLAATMAVLRAAWRWRSFREVARRRDRYQGLEAGLDVALTARGLRPGLVGGPAATAALRSVVMGDTVVETQAARWNGGDASCPSCTAPREDLEHRWWGCPVTEPIRFHVFGHFAPGAHADMLRLPPCVRLAGCFPVEEGVPLRKLAAHHAWPAAVFGAAFLPDAARAIAWTDGGGLHPGDAALATASWAVDFGVGDPRNGCGLVRGRPTSQRGEVEAAFEALNRHRGPLCIVTDSRYVFDKLQRLVQGRPLPACLDEDIWRACAQLGATLPGRLAVRWVPAHRPAPDPPLLSADDWAGNQRADMAAGAALRTGAPPPDLVARRRARKELAARIQTLIARVQEAVLERDHCRAGDGLPRIRRLRRRHRPTGPGRSAPEAVLPQPVAPMPDSPLGVHQLARLPDGALVCQRCGISRAPMRYALLAFSQCGEGPRPSWGRIAHQVVPGGDGWAVCTRCDGRSRNTKQFQRATCPARWLSGPYLVDWGRE